MILSSKDGKYKREVNPCRMAEEPLTFGIPIKLSDELWRILKEDKEFILDGKLCKIVQEIDIGENTWFIFETSEDL
ncbi:MAG: hypothetical protein ACP5G5_02615 [Thermoplasmata archaeon]|nr:hypothetical protein [Thermoplasmatales archaeon]